MALGRPPGSSNFPPELRVQVLELIDQGTKPVAQIARDLNLSKSTINNWRHRDRAKVLRSEPMEQPTTKPKRKAAVEKVEIPISELAPHKLEAWRKSQKPKKAKLLLKGKMSERDAAELMVLLDLKPADLAPLQRVLILAKQVGMTTEELVESMIKLVMERAFALLKLGQ